MPDVRPTARGPFPAVGPTRIEEGWEISTTAHGQLTLTDLSRLGKFSVRSIATEGKPAEFPPPWQTLRSDDRLIAAGAAGEWLVITTSTAERALPGRDSHGQWSVVVDVTHGRAMLRLDGAAAVELLSRLCAVDLKEAATAGRDVVRSYVGAVVTDIIREDLDGSPSFIVHCERSVGRSMLDALLDAGADLGMVFAGDGGNSPSGRRPSSVPRARGCS